MLRCPAVPGAGVCCVVLALESSLALHASDSSASTFAGEPSRSFICAWDDALWVVSPAGDGRMRLAGGPDFPIFDLLVASPNGERMLLACPGEEKVYLLESGGRIRALGKLRGIGLGGPEVKWSPDGGLVAFETGYLDVPVVDLNSGEWYEALTPEADVETFDDPVGWASGEDLIVARTDRIATSLYTVLLPPSPTHKAQKLVERPGGYHAAALSPDKRSVALWVGPEVLLVDLPLGKVKALPADLVPDPGEAECQVTWSIQSAAIFLRRAHGYDDGQRVFLVQEIGVDGSVCGSPSQVFESDTLAPGIELPPAIRDSLRRLFSIPDGPGPWEFGGVAATPLPPEYWLLPAAEPGSNTTLTVSSDPAGAEVYANGHLKGISPCTVRIASAQPWAQRYFVALMKDDLDIVCRELFLRQGQTEDLAVSLQAPLTAPHWPASVAQARNAVRKAIVHRDVEGFIRCLSPLGLAAEGIDVPAQGPVRHWSRTDVAQRLRRDHSAKPDQRSFGLYGMVFDTCRHLFLTGVYSGQDGDHWQGGTEWYWGASIGLGPGGQPSTWRASGMARNDARGEPGSASEA